MSLTFIRHAETDLAGTFCGHSDPPLNRNGQNQLQILLSSLPGGHFESIHTSDLQRATSTAHAIANTHATRIVTNKSLREIHFGDWESLTWPQIEQRDPAYAQRWLNEYPNLPAPNGESYEAFRTRILEAVAPLLHSEKNTAIVTHAGVLQLILTTYANRTPEQAWQETKPFCSHFTIPSGTTK